MAALCRGGAGRGRAPDERDRPVRPRPLRLCATRRPTGSISRSARSCSGTRCASGATTGSSTRRPASRRSSTSTGRWWRTPAPSSGRPTTPSCGSCRRRASRSIADRRPFVIIDPRAGHGPGIGGFKQDSQVGVALKAGHPVYFVIFFPEPVPGQTLADVSRAEAEFLRIVARRHPDTRKPVVIGNCQGGWASMLVGALEPDLTGPIVINGAPMSYWAGNDGENPMRYAGGMLGGVWPALLASDLGGGQFDGAHLVENFESLNPANTLLRQVLQPVLQDRHRTRALPRVRALVGRLLPDGSPGDQVDRPEPVRRQQPSRRRSRVVRGTGLRPARHQVADHPVRVSRRQHHAAAAGLQLGRRSLSDDRGTSRPTAR